MAKKWNFEYLESDLGKNSGQTNQNRSQDSQDYSFGLKQGLLLGLFWQNTTKLHELKLLS